MLALVLACSISAGGVRAQTNAEYNFRHQSTVVGSSYGNPLNSEDAPELTMSCLAANGYGQWTLCASAGTGSPNTNFPIGWYLLANSLYTPSTHYDGTTNNPGCIPPGVVQSGSFSFPNNSLGQTEVKATTNLEGMEGFIWPDVTTPRQSFVINGFTASDVDLSLSFLSNPTPPMNVVTHAIHSLTGGTNVSTDFPAGITHAVVLESDWRDNSDYCSDAYYNYIIWASTDHPTFAGQKEVWVMAVPIGSSTPTVGPLLVDDGVNHDGQYPTITCDPRNNQIGTPAPAFDVAYIQPSVNAINFGSWNGAGWTTAPHALAKTFWNSPTGTLPWGLPYHARIVRNSVYAGTSSLGIYVIVNRDVLAHSAGGILLAYYDPAHLTGAADYVAGDFMPPPAPLPTTPYLPIHDAPIIAFADPYDNQANWHSADEIHCLYQYYIAGGASGKQNPLCVVRGADVAFGWPDLYHAYTPDPSNQDTRLVLNEWTNIHGTEILENDPTGNYVAAVNQMGIHVHWLSDSSGLVVHNYTRDLNRTFDEPIDENTLVTDQCFVTDGSSTGTNHGGTIGATVMTPSTFGAVTRITVWSDPNYGPPSLDGTSGLYSPRILTSLNPYVGTLNFAGTSGTTNLHGTNVILNVGDNILHSDEDFGYYTGGTLVVMPNFLFNFVPNQGQGVTINYTSTFDYYGLFATHNGSGVQLNIGTPFTDGTADGVGAGTIDLEGGGSTDYVPHYATLNVHGGADFYTGASGTLISNTGSINVEYEAAVYPTTTGMANLPLTGHMTLLGQSTLTGGEVLGNIPYSATDPAFARRVIMTVDAGFVSGYSSYQFQATGVNFQNSDTKGTSELRFGHSRIGNTTQSFSKCVFDGCSCSAIEIHAIDPTWGFSGELDIVDGCDFENIRNKCIFIENDQNPITAWYGFIVIDGNTFGTFAPDVDVASVSDELVGTSFISAPYGIYLKNFDDNATGTWREDFLQYANPVISNNQFTNSGNWNADLNVQSITDHNQFGTGSSAIGLENTTAMVIGNTISDDGYSAAIGIRKSGLTPPNTYTIICSNMISGMMKQSRSTTVDEGADEYGISSNYGLGMISLNSITGGDFGISFYSDDNSFLDSNTVTNYLEAGLDVENGSIPHLTGVGTSENPYPGAYNTFSGPTIDPTEAEEHPIIYFVYAGGLDLYNGKNNIFYTGTPEGFYLIMDNGDPTGTITNLGDVDGNWWGTNLDPYIQSASCSSFCTCANCSWKTPSEGDLGGGGSYYYQATLGGVVGPNSTPSSGPCPAAAGYATITSKRTIKPLSVGDDTENCDSLRFKIWNYSGAKNFQPMYDTTEKFIETCYNDFWAPSMFQYFSASLQPLAETDTSLWLEGRQWLESVLYLNTTNPEYFCACVEAIAGTYNSPSDTSEELYWIDENRGLAIGRWLLQNTTCDSSLLSNNFDATRASQYSSWLNDTTVPLDTTLPTMQQLGLDTLLNRHFLYASVSNPPQPSIISNPTANPNPTGEGTVISFGISQEAYVKIELFDILGHEVGSAGFESLFEPGNKSVPLSLAGLPSSTYFARILTAYGETQSVKLVKE